MSGPTFSNLKIKSFTAVLLSIFLIDGAANAQSSQIGVSPTQRGPISVDDLNSSSRQRNSYAAQKNSQTATAEYALQVSENFKVQPEFKIEKLFQHEECGSVECFTFDSYSRMFVGQTGGPIFYVNPMLAPGDPQRVKKFSSQITSCGGLLSVNGRLYATGNGPDGMGLYVLDDKNRDGVADNISQLIRFKTLSDQYGPHGLTLGYDGRIYITVGHETDLDGRYAADGPLRNSYDAKLSDSNLIPLSGKTQRFGTGSIIRTDLAAKRIELVASGLKNPIDIAFNEFGEPFTADVDTSEYAGLPWYRPSDVHLVHEGAEYGWRSDSVWPQYYSDLVAPVCNLGKSTPSGIAFYQHWMFPQNLQFAMFVGDKANGRVYSMKLDPKSGEYETEPEIFLEAAGASVNDLEIGQDGSLYFATGKKNLNGGIYRVSWTGKKPDLSAATRDAAASLMLQPQLNTPWARQRLAKVKKTLGDRWESTLKGIMVSEKNPPTYRIKSMEMLQLFGPVPSSEMLTKLSKTANSIVRGKAAQMLALKRDALSQSTLKKLLADTNPMVRRRAAEAIYRSKTQVTYADIRPLLSSGRKAEEWTARKILETLPTNQWLDDILASQDQRLFINGSIAALSTTRQTDISIKVLARASELMNGHISDRNFVDVLRVMQLSMILGKIDPSTIPAFQDRIVEEFPAGNQILNVEIAKLLLVLGKPAGDRIVEYLGDKSVPAQDRLSVAYYLIQIEKGWSPSQQTALVKFLESTGKTERMGASVARRIATLKSMVTQQAVPNSPNRTNTIPATPASTRMDKPAATSNPANTTNPAPGIQGATPLVTKLPATIGVNNTSTQGNLQTTSPSRSSDAASMPEQKIPQRTMTTREAIIALKAGASNPDDAIKALFEMPQELSPAQFTALVELDSEISNMDTEQIDNLKRGVIAVLARSGSEQAMAYLRKAWGQNPIRRGDLAMGLSQKPGGENWPYVVASLGEVNGEFAQDIFAQLVKVNRRPKDPRYYRQVILKATKAKPEGAQKGIDLLHHWLPDAQVAKSTDTTKAIQDWKDWFHTSFPTMPRAEYPIDDANSKWPVTKAFTSFQNSKNGASPLRGKLVFESALCSRCHQSSGVENSIGPNLANLIRRKSTEEIIRSIVHPSFEVSDQYHSNEVATVFKTEYEGIARKTVDGKTIVIQKDAKQTVIPNDEIASSVRTHGSIMPTQLIEGLSEQELIDLIAYIIQPESERLAERAQSRTNR